MTDATANGFGPRAIDVTSDAIAKPLVDWPAGG